MADASTCNIRLHTPQGVEVRLAAIDSGIPVCCEASGRSGECNQHATHWVKSIMVSPPNIADGFPVCGNCSKFYSANLILPIGRVPFVHRRLAILRAAVVALMDERAHPAPRGGQDSDIPF